MEILAINKDAFVFGDVTQNLKTYIMASNYSFLSHKQCFHAYENITEF